MKTITGLAIALAAAAASLVAVSCTRFEYKEDLIGGGKVFHASFEAVGAPDTKTYLDSEHKLLWTADDRLSIFEGNTYNQQYRYTGQTGETSADFEKVQTSGFHSGNDISSNYAVYPYLQENKIGNDGKMTIALPSVQQYAAGSFGLGANTMVAVTNGTSDTFLAFKNLCGYLVIKLYGEGTVKSISFKGNSGEKIAGSATVTASYGREPALVMTNTATEEITLDCGSGVALGSTSQTATEFWFCIPPVTFSKGFSIKVTNTSGWAMEKSISSSRTISRNTINSMSALKAEFTDPPIPVPEMDYSVSVEYQGIQIEADGKKYVKAGISVGADVDEIKLAMSKRNERDLMDAILGGKVPTTTIAVSNIVDGVIRIPVNDEGSGRYLLMAITYGGDSKESYNAQKYDSVQFIYSCGEEQWIPVAGGDYTFSGGQNGTYTIAKQVGYPQSITMNLYKSDIDGSKWRLYPYIIGELIFYTDIYQGVYIEEGNTGLNISGNPVEVLDATLNGFMTKSGYFNPENDIFHLMPCYVGLATSSVYAYGEDTFEINSEPYEIDETKQSVKEKKFSEMCKQIKWGNPKPMRVRHESKPVFSDVKVNMTDQN